MGSSQLFRFLSRPRTVKEVARRLGVTVDHVEQALQEALQSGSIAKGSENDQNSPGTLVVSGQLLSLVPRSMGSKRALGMPKVQSPIRAKNDPWSRYQRVHLKFKDTAPNVVKKVAHSAVLSEVFKAKEKVNHESPTRVSLPLEARMLDSLMIGPKTVMDLRAALGVSRRNIGSLERKGLVSSFWGPNGVGRMFRITRKGSTELERLKMVSSINRRMMEKTQVSLRKITPLSPV